MGEIVSRMSDVVILTQDDDYSENPQRIIKDVLPGIDRKQGEDFGLLKIVEKRFVRRLSWQKKMILSCLQEKETNICLSQMQDL